MPNDEHVTMPARGAAAWNEWRADRDETPDLSQAGLRGLDLSGFDLSRADLRGAEGSNLSGANRRLRIWTAPTSSRWCDGADLAGAFLNRVQSLNCAQLIVTQNWQSVFRDDELACDAPIPGGKPSE
jgi:uncharacterized protein YjbI with pentapeptide repeats